MAGRSQFGGDELRKGDFESWLSVEKTVEAGIEVRRCMKPLTFVLKETEARRSILLMFPWCGALEEPGAPSWSCTWTCSRPEKPWLLLFSRDRRAKSSKPLSSSANNPESCRVANDMLTPRERDDTGCAELRLGRVDDWVDMMTDALENVMRRKTKRMGQADVCYDLGVVVVVVVVVVEQRNGRTEGQARARIRSGSRLMVMERSA